VRVADAGRGAALLTEALGLVKRERMGTVPLPDDAQLENQP
jgi:hypothetical protein